MYRPSDGETFSMGSETFSKGFAVVADNYSLLGEGNGYALFDLNGQHLPKEITIDLGYSDNLKLEVCCSKIVYGFADCTLER